MRRPLGACGTRSSPAAAFLLAAAAICAQFAAGLADDPSKDGNKDDSKGHTGQTVLFVLLGLVQSVCCHSSFSSIGRRRKERNNMHDC
uniref:Predicted protein n=1 Tax=Hordeum vulgare subsp. vulgare TaxID=112509 RepID=F2DL72_HORVV|nr:predicted protein [Hordeum vulgare subsp. vulgare]